MLICLDYDGTYTADPLLWQLFIKAAVAAGHKVICATMRYEAIEGESVKNSLKHLVEEIYFTNRLAKVTWLKERGICPDVWIDDSPFWLLNNASDLKL